jgi:hypothetical protein
MTFLRRVRAAAVLALAWAVLWAPFGAVLFVLFAGWVVDDFWLSWRDLLRLLGRGAYFGGVWGLVSGAIFAAALGAAERRGGVEHLARRRVIGWGALSGAGFPMIAVLMLAASIRDGGVYLPGLLAGMGVGALFGALVAGSLLSAAGRTTVTEGA